MPSGEELDVDSAKDERVTNNTMRHQSPVLTDVEKIQMAQIKDLGLQFDRYLTAFGSKREYSIAKTKIEEAVMWAVKGLTQ